MKVTFKIIVLSFFLVGIIFARNGKNNPRVEENKVNSEHYVNSGHYFVKDHSEDNGNNKLDRKRSHKRRRRVRKPVKGLR